MTTAIPDVSSTPPSAAASTQQGAKASVDYDSFLRLLVAEMKNQDPTKPMDSTQYVAQLATFSQVEQLIQSNSKLDQILQASALSQADAVIGRQITSADGGITGIVAEVRLTSDGITAVLESGEEIAVVPGVAIAAADE